MPITPLLFAKLRGYKLQGRVFAIVVTYLPDVTLLRRLIEALSAQVDYGCIVNNGTSLPLSESFFCDAGFEVIHLDSNLGVAAALNVGMRRAQTKCALYALTFDQDSEPYPHMVLRLLKAHRELELAHGSIGAVGPEQIDPRSGRVTPFISNENLLRNRVKAFDGQCLEVDHVITSGMLMSVAAWERTGPFSENLFIDYVDTEWCLRARHMGLRIFGVGGARLLHQLGDSVDHYARWQVPIHDPSRHYYIFRNGVTLMRQSHISWRWKFSNMIQLAKQFVYFSVCKSQRLAYLKAAVRGISHGLTHNV